MAILRLDAALRYDAKSGHSEIAALHNGEAFAMLATVEPCLSRGPTPHNQPLREKELLLWMLSAVMSFDTKKIGFQPSGNPDDLYIALSQFLDGYFNSADHYPVCTRQLFTRNDAFALWSDFVKISEDFSGSTQNMIFSPERFLDLESLTSGEITTRKKSAAAGAVEKIAERIKSDVARKSNPANT